MKTPVTSLSVWVDRTAKVAWIKISGRASFTSSVDFKTLVNSLWQRHYTRFVLDLTECPLMDSTFLGVLAGLGLKFSNAPDGENKPTIELLNPNPRIADLLENLGVAHLFQIAHGPKLAPETLAQAEPEPSAPAADRLELARTSLEAHKTLMEINPDNVPKFKDVTEFLAEDLKRLEDEQ